MRSKSILIQNLLIGILFFLGITFVFYSTERQKKIEGSLQLAEAQIVDIEVVVFTDLINSSREVDFYFIENSNNTPLSMKRGWWKDYEPKVKSGREARLPIDLDMTVTLKSDPSKEGIIFSIHDIQKTSNGLIYVDASYHRASLVAGGYLFIIEEAEDGLLIKSRQETWVS